MMLVFVFVGRRCRTQTHSPICLLYVCIWLLPSRSLFPSHFPFFLPPPSTLYSQSINLDACLRLCLRARNERTRMSIVSSRVALQSREREKKEKKKKKKKDAFPLFCGNNNNGRRRRQRQQQCVQWKIQKLRVIERSNAWFA